jgi:predicted dehydrogenase
MRREELKMSKLRTAVIGAGIGRYHVMGYEAHPNAEVVAICDLNPAAAAELAAKHGVARVFEDYKRMFAEAEVDAVSVCVPNAFHMPVVMDCLAAGKHVLCEKPLARNAKEGQKMVEAAVKAGRLLMIQFNNRYRPEAQVLKKYVADGTLGDIYFARAGWVRRNGIPGLCGRDFLVS